MWSKPSLQPQRRSSAVAIDDTPSPEALLAAGRYIAGRNVYGIVWIDRHLIVRSRYGGKAGFIAAGEPLTGSVIPLIGAEDEILGLQSNPQGSVELPGVVIHTGADAQERFNLSLFWDPAQDCYLLLVARASLDAALEVELLRHVRFRLMAEEQIKAKSAELARANRDLEDFAAIISHDLRAPMRALKYMTDDLEETLAAGRMADAHTKLAWIRSQSQRMSSMLSALLDYSSIGRKARALEPVDTRSLVTQIAASLPVEGSIEIVIAGAWPTLETLRAPLDLVLRNLADNAIKHHDRPRGTVTLTAAETPEALRITVADDGPGIAIEHRQAIFMPFRTLATGDAAASAGIGMGLALVERTVGSVGGSISLLPADPGQRGTTFEVIWPKMLPPALNHQ